MRRNPGEPLQQPIEVEIRDRASNRTQRLNHGQDLVTHLPACASECVRNFAFFRGVGWQDVDYDAFQSQLVNFHTHLGWEVEEGDSGLVNWLSLGRRRSERTRRDGHLVLMRVLLYHLRSGRRVESGGLNCEQAEARSGGPLYVVRERHQKRRQVRGSTPENCRSAVANRWCTVASSSRRNPLLAVTPL